MDFSNNTGKEALRTELETLRDELTMLKTEKSVFEAQQKLLENFLSIARSPMKEGMLRTILENTLEVSRELTGAEKGSIFLLDTNGVVSDSILTRKDAETHERSRLIGTVLDKGLAGWVSRNRRVGMITDTENDNRWITLPNQPYTVRSALAVPIQRGTDLLGLLTLLHSAPNHFSEASVDLMKLTAVQLAIVLENARLYSKLDDSYRDLEKAKQKIEAYSTTLRNELEKGRQIQKDFLPHQIHQIPGWDIVAYFHPANQLSGDFYDVFTLPDDNLGLVIADVCDKGVGAALFMAMFRSLIRIFSGHIPFPAIDGLDGPDPYADALKAIAYTNDYLSLNHGDMCMFATLFLGVLNPKTGELKYINGGHEPPAIVGPTGVKKRLAPTGPAVGIMPNTPFDIQTVRLDPGDIFIGYTDGVTEACSPDGELFTGGRFKSLLEGPCECATDLMERILAPLFSHIADAPRSDDITLLAVGRSAS
jgi:sigma-B regulation protein RsbU (phosphoserine phosphatase)